jgi:hypothetical protein
MADSGWLPRPLRLRTSPLGSMETLSICAATLTVSASA